MPLIDSLHKDNFTRIICWKTEESDEELLDFLQLSPYRIMKYLTLTPKQGKEYLGLRACLKILDLDLEIYYDSKGKPYLPANNQISITHSYNMVCVGLSEFKIGIDIEKNRPSKIHNIKEKFIREQDEAIWIPKENESEYLHVIWGIKEGLYKLNGGNIWNFLHHYRVEPFELIEKQLSNVGFLTKPKSRKYFAHYTKVEDYYLVWVLDYE